jgi:hypothetical protein
MARLFVARLRLGFIVSQVRLGESAAVAVIDGRNPADGEWRD